MNFFEEASLRLKQELSLIQDKEIADVLGLSARAWAGRKDRGTFPEKELYTLVAKRPDMDIDVTYVLTGQKTPPHERAAFDRMDKTTRLIEPDAAGPLSKAALDARKQHGLQLRKRIEALENQFVNLDDSDRLLVEQLVDRCVRAAKLG